jgi:leucyl/phenylalanyl-tRNA---protein transferase
MPKRTAVGNRRSAESVGPPVLSLVRGSVAGWSDPPQPVGESLWTFPSPDDFPAHDVVGFGGDLEPSTLIGAYRRGLFPMPLETPEPLLAWWSPDPRGIVPLDGLRVTRSLRQSAKRYEVRLDTCFEEVIRRCADPARPKAWITPEFITAYVALHRLGWAHSIETFNREGMLTGGLYGVRIEGLFAGESMFHVESDASKVALMALVALMRESKMSLLDVQWHTEHLGSLGAIEVPRTQYLVLLSAALGVAGRRGEETPISERQEGGSGKSGGV